MRHTLSLTIAVGIVLTVACTNGVDAEDYARDCSADADCVVIYVGDACDCACDSSAINARDQPKYRDDRGECSGGCGTVDCGPCPSQAARCQAGRCVSVPDNPGAPDAGSD